MHRPVQSIASATLTTITWDTVFSNPDAMWSAGAPTRITAPVGGLYMAIPAAFWNPNAAGHREIQGIANGVTVYGRDTRNAVATAAVQTVQNAVTTWTANAGDYLEVQVAQNSGGALDVFAGIEVFRVAYPA